MAPQEGKKVVKKTPAKGGKKKATKKQTGKGKAAREGEPFRVIILLQLEGPEYL